MTFLPFCLKGAKSSSFRKKGIKILQFSKKRMAMRGFIAIQENNNASVDVN